MDEPRWLDDAEQRIWRSFLELNRLLMRALDRQLQVDSGLSLADYEVLSILSESPDRRLRMSELAERTTFSKSRLSHAVSRLEASGWIARVECPEDRRGLFAQLTEAGMAVLAGAAPGHVAAVRRYLFDPLSGTQVRQLGAVTAAVKAALDAELAASPAGPPPGR
jgi:DNA-binding MarR family transcriptional regulator